MSAAEPGASAKTSAVVPGADSVIVVGMSAGALPALRTFLTVLPLDFPAAAVIAYHTGPVSVLPQLIACWTKHHVGWAGDGIFLQPGRIYVNPGQRHLVINPDTRLTVTPRPPLRWARPSIDWLFESAAASYGGRAIGVVLSGANHDGARGAARIARAGGMVIAQHPATATFAEMPRAAQSASGALMLCPPDIAGVVTARIAALAGKPVTSWWDFAQTSAA